MIEFIILINGFSASEAKYDFIEDGSTLTARSISVLNEIKPPPSKLSAAYSAFPWISPSAFLFSRFFETSNPIYQSHGSYPATLKIILIKL